MHVLITGGCGFIGSHLVEYHLNKGNKVHVVDDLSTGSIHNVSAFQNNPNFQFDKADILTWSGLEKSAVWADQIYHMAAVVGVYRVLAEPINVLATNIPGCERVLRAVAATGWKPRVLIASSSEVYGQSLTDNIGFKESDNLVIESAAKNRWNYAISKIADEAFGLSYARELNLPVTLIRFFNTIGPRQTGRYGMVVPRLVEQAVHNQPITVYGDGSQSRSFCDVRDTVVALDALANTPDSVGEIINVGNDREISINHLAELIRNRANSNSPIVHIPYEEAYGKAFGETFIDILRRRPNLEKFYGLTHFKHQWTLEQTIDDLITRVRDHTTLPREENISK